MKSLSIILSIIVVFVSSQEIRFQWKYPNYTWPSSKVYNNALHTKQYIPKNNVVTGLKVWNGRIYITIPRWRSGVPATLVSTAANRIHGESSPLLEPYPSWEMQKLDDCSAFQFVQSMEIDLKGRMWVIDNGRTEISNPKPKTKCPARLVILDLNNRGKILIDYKFPKTVVNSKSVSLNDIVLDHENGGWAYITDSDNKYPGIIVFSLKNKKSWKVTHQSMKAEEKYSHFIVNGTSITLRGPVNGIALSPASTKGDRILYYSSLASLKIYSVPVNVLKNCKLCDIDRNVRLVGKKSSVGGGMVMSSSGSLYFGLYTKDAVAKWNTRGNYTEIIHYQNRVTNQWSDTFAIDEMGQLWWTTNRLQRFFTNRVNVKEINYRIIVSKIHAKGYTYQH